SGTETGAGVTWRGVQVHGGMGYFEETGAEELHRHGRILPIYESTTAIQANDFIGRKILRDGGTVALGMVAQMRDTTAQLRDAAGADGDDAPALSMMAQRLDAAVSAYETALRHVLDTARADPRSQYVGSVPLLMLA